MKRMICTLLAALLAVMMMCSGALADAGLSIQSVDLSKADALNLVLKVTDANYASLADFSVKYDTVEVTPSAFNTYETSGMATTHFFVVDLSTIRSNNGGTRIEDLKITLDYLIDRMPAIDNAVIVTAGMSASELNPTLDKNALHDAVDELKYDQNKNKLGSAISAATKYIKDGSAGLNARACIYVLSNGENSNLTGGEISTLSKEIATVKATVYTIAFKRNDHNAETVKSFGQLATKSMGGIAIETDYIRQGSGDAKYIEDAEATRIIDKINDNEKLFSVLASPLTTDTPKDFANITVSFKSGNLTYSDSYALTGDQRTKIAEKIDQLVVSEPTAEPTATPEPNIVEGVIEFVKANVMIVAFGGVIAVLVIVLLVLLVSRGKKKEPVSEEPSSEEDKTMPADDDDNGKTMPVSETLVALTPVSQGDIIVNNNPASINGTIKIGRNASKCRLVIASRVSEADIATVSREHATLTLRGSSLVIENLSGNGTKVNNMKIDRPVALQQNDIITLGTVSFRINWR